MEIFVRSSLFNYDTDAASVETGLECLDESRAIQSQAEEADINTIVRNFGITQTLPATLRVPSYGDFTGAGTYHEVQTLMVEAKEAFMALPSALRAEFDNDPGRFIDWTENATPEALAKYGIAREGDPVPPQTNSSNQKEAKTPKSEGESQPPSGSGA